MPLVRLQFRGLPEEQRKGFVFENMVDQRGIEYHTPVAVSVLAGSDKIYSTGMMCPVEEIEEKRVLQGEYYKTEELQAQQRETSYYGS